MKKITPDMLVFEFTILLTNVEPFVWRKIEVPATYSFWDLHVAIQDAFGWLDTHLHEFMVVDPETRQQDRIGIPDDEDVDDPVEPGWELPLVEYLSEHDQRVMTYLYDFGDDWCHAVMLNGAHMREAGVAYPRCTGGARACPPDDCGGPHGYTQLLAALADPSHPEYGSYRDWVRPGFSPEAFDPASVEFDDPEKRLTFMLENV